MNGPEHYRAAERLLERANGIAPGAAAELRAEAQVHATLALAAAQVEAVAARAPGDLSVQWLDVLA